MRAISVNATSQTPTSSVTSQNALENVYATNVTANTATNTHTESHYAHRASHSRPLERGLRSVGNWGSYVVTFSVFLFALSTMISWSYYGDRCVVYLVGSRFVTPYRIVYVVFSFIGSMAALRLVWDYGDLAIGLMAVPNLIAVALLMPRVVRMTGDYFQRMQARASEK